MRNLMQGVQNVSVSQEDCLKKPRSICGYLVACFRIWNRRALEMVMEDGRWCLEPLGASCGVRRIILPQMAMPHHRGWLADHGNGPYQQAHDRIDGRMKPAVPDLVRSDLAETTASVPRDFE
ncbi:hypothetical protein CCHR01_18911 [Colletotrichum chrysophilum]|uniref:Uncharacterized protein n=1 Tax=Colletotrichum chrysophilum TaxID=1836956 RepID=A0AAD9A0Q6_9PEZI|nr:hypothetical protein CCHR01_18911 [Colletotrichum chrysophilum]